MKELFLSQDIYAENVEFNFKGKKKWPSTFGATLSLLIFVSVFVFSVTRMLAVVSFQTEKIKVAD